MTVSRTKRTSSATKKPTARTTAAKPRAPGTATSKSATPKPAISNPATPSAAIKPGLKAPDKTTLATSAADSKKVGVPVGSAPDPKLVAVSKPDSTQTDLKKRELIDLVVTRSGIKKKDAKPVVEAMLAVLGETIAGGRELNLQPFGKLRINRKIDKGNGKIIVCKLRQGTSVARPPKDPLAEAAE